LLFFGRLVFDDLDKRQFIHLGIHIAIVASLITLLAGNRCSLPRLYFVYFIGYVSFPFFFRKSLTLYFQNFSTYF
jgi:hypothetical protein